MPHNNILLKNNGFFTPFFQLILLVEKRATFVNLYLSTNVAQTVGFLYGSDSPVVLHIYPSVIKTMVIIYHKITQLSMYLVKVCEIFSTLFFCNKCKHLFCFRHDTKSTFFCCDQRRSTVGKTKHFLKIFFCQSCNSML